MAEKVTATVNGAAQSLDPGTTLEALVRAWGADPARVVVERNRLIVAKDDFAVATVADGDVIEIVQFVGGG